MKFTVGQKVYRVGAMGLDDMKVEEATIESIGKSTLKLADRTGLAFDCRTRVDLAVAEELYASTKQEAWDIYLAELRRALKGHEDDLVELKKTIDRAFKRRLAESRRTTLKGSE